jgi:hypothetical protein
MSSLSLSNSCRTPDLFAGFSPEALVGTSQQKVDITFAHNCFLSTGSIAFLTAWGLLHLTNDGELTLGGAPGVLNYLSRLNVLKTLKMPNEEPFERRAESGRFIPVQLIEDPASCKQAVDRVCDLVLHQCEDSRGFLPALEWAINEITDNIHLHAAATVPGVLVAQYFAQLRRIDVAICDMGRGIKASLQPRFPLSSHEDAIVKAMERGITRDPEVGMGNGMAGTLQIMRANWGILQIWTGNTTLTIYPGCGEQFSQHSALPGTGLVLSFSADHPVDLKDTFIGSPKYTYLEWAADRLAEGVPLRIVEECASTGNRAPALALRRKIRALLPDLPANRTINLDFSGVAYASSSFMDELFGRLAAEIGPDEVRARIRILGAKEELLDIANVVIDQRLQMEGEP